MSTKADLTTLIDTDVPDGLRLNAVQLRNVLGDDLDSMLENIYGTEVMDTELTQTYFTLLDPGSASFLFHLMKQGRQVFLNGTITSNVPFLVQLGSFKTGVYEAMLNQRYNTAGIKEGTSIINEVEVRDTLGTTSILIKIPLLLGETLNFGITYNSNT